MRGRDRRGVQAGIVQIVFDVLAEPYEQRLPGAAGRPLSCRGECRVQRVEERLAGDGQARVIEMIELPGDGLQLMGGYRNQAGTGAGAHRTGKARGAVGQPFRDSFPRQQQRELTVRLHTVEALGQFAVPDQQVVRADEELLAGVPAHQTAAQVHEDSDEPFAARLRGGRPPTGEPPAAEVRDRQCVQPPVADCRLEPLLLRERQGPGEVQFGHLLGPGVKGSRLHQALGRPDTGFGHSRPTSSARAPAQTSVDPAAAVCQWPCHQADRVKRPADTVRASHRVFAQMSNPACASRQAPLRTLPQTSVKSGSTPNPS